MAIIFAGIIACLAMDIFQRLLLMTFGHPHQIGLLSAVGPFMFCALRASTNQPLTAQLKSEANTPLAGLSIMQSALATLLSMPVSCKLAC